MDIHRKDADMQLGGNIFLVADLGMKVLYHNPVHGSTLLAFLP
jgi:hypothetical protein